MSSITYHLRTVRPEAGVASHPRSRVRPTPPRGNRSSVSLHRDPAPHIVGRTPLTDPAPALYSDVAASRPPSPQKDTASLPVASSIVLRDDERIPSLTRDAVNVVSRNNSSHHQNRNHSSSEMSDHESTPWTTFQQTCAQP